MKIILTNYSFLGITNPAVEYVVRDMITQNAQIPIANLKSKFAKKLEDLAESKGKSVEDGSINKKTYSQAISEGIQQKVYSGERVGRKLNHKYTI